MDKQEVAVVEIRMSFLSLITFFVKAAVAAIPAFIIFYVLAQYIVFFVHHGF